MGRFIRDTIDFFVVKPGADAFVLTLIASTAFLLIGYLVEALVHMGVGAAISWVGIVLAWLLGVQLVNMWVRQFILGQDTSSDH